MAYYTPYAPAGPYGAPPARSPYAYGPRPYSSVFGAADAVTPYAASAFYGYPPYASAYGAPYARLANAMGPPGPSFAMSPYAGPYGNPHMGPGGFMGPWGPMAEQDRLAAAFMITDSTAWVDKMKKRFESMDVNKDGRISDADVAELAKKLASFRNEGPEKEREYTMALGAVWTYGIRGSPEGVTMPEFIAGMKELVVAPDARVRLAKYAKTVFDIIDADHNGTLSLDEFMAFHSAVNSNVNKGIVEKVFKAADTNNNNKIEEAEFEQSIVKFFTSADEY